MTSNQLTHVRDPCTVGGGFLCSNNKQQTHQTWKSWRLLLKQPYPSEVCHRPRERTTAGINPVKRGVPASPQPPHHRAHRQQHPDLWRKTTDGSLFFGPGPRWQLSRMWGGEVGVAMWVCGGGSKGQTVPQRKSWTTCKFEWNLYKEHTRSLNLILSFSIHIHKCLILFVHLPPRPTTISAPTLLKQIWILDVKEILKIKDMYCNSYVLCYLQILWFRMQSASAACVGVSLLVFPNMSVHVQRRSEEGGGSLFGIKSVKDVFMWEEVL